MIYQEESQEVPLHEARHMVPLCQDPFLAILG